MLLRAGSLRLVLAQSEVGAAQYLDARADTGDRTYAALSEHMTMLPERPAERFVVTTLGDDEGSDLGWCWDELRVLIDVELQARPLPPVLLAPHTPVNCYVELAGGELAYVCDARSVAKFALAAAGS